MSVRQAPLNMDLDRLARAIATKRADRTLREIEVETGISKSTLSRMERGLTCDIQSFAAAIRWTGEDAAVVLGLRSPDV